MARGKKLEKALPLEEMLELALVPEEEQPYEIPGNWCWVKLKSICEFERGITFPATAKENKETKKNIACLRTANIQNDLQIEDLIYVNKEYMKGNDAKLVRKDDIIMSSANSRELVGKTSYVYTLPFPMTFGGFVLTIRAKHVLSKYLFYYLRLQFLTGKFMGESTQTTNIANINTKILGNYALALPPCPEQIRIVERIEKLFNQLEEAKAKIQSVRDGFEGRKAAILYRAFTGELIGIKNKGTVPLENIVDAIKIGPFGSALHKKDYISDGVPVINPKHICAQKIISEDKVSITIEKAKELQSYKLQENDIVMGRRGEMGRSAPVTKREAGWLCGTGSLIIRLKKGYIASFYSQIIASHSAVQYLEEHSVGSTMKNLNEKVIKSLPVPNYTIKQQKEIINVLDQILSREQQAKRITEIILTQMETLKKSILAQAFRGQLGTNDPIEKNICSYNLLEIL